MAGRFVLTAAPSRSNLLLMDLRSGERWRLPWPSGVGRTGQGGADEAAVQRDGRLIALGFSDPAYQGGATQVTDIWVLDPASHRIDQLPDMPAAVSLEFTSIAWARGRRLMILAQTARRDVVGVWAPGQKRISVRRVRLPARDSGSDSFVAWPSAGSA